MLPNAPSRMDTSPISVKYSQPMPASASGRHMERERYVKIAPSTPTIKKANSTMNIAVEALERWRFFFAS